MDIGLFIVLMIVVYVVPELLKRLKKKKPYQYPDFRRQRRQLVNILQLPAFPANCRAA